MAWTTIATALLLIAPLGAKDPEVALKEITDYRTAVVTKARAEQTTIDTAALNAEVKKRALEAIDGITPGSIDAAKGYSWMQLFAMAEKYEDIEMLCHKYMMSSPNPQQAFNAEIMCLQAFNSLKQYGKGAEVISGMNPPNEAASFTLVSYATAWFAEPIAEEKGVPAAMEFLDGVLAKLPKEVTQENLKPRLASAVAGIYETKGEILMKHGKKEEGLAMFKAGTKDPRVPAANARSLEYAGIRAGLIGAAPPAIPFTEKYGDYTSLADLKGKVVMVDFMAHWCGPCIAAFPSMRKLYDAKKSEGFEIISVTRYYGYFGQERPLEPKAEYDKMSGFLEKHNINWPTVFTPNDSFGSYGVTGIPTMAIIGRDGKIQMMHVGFSDALFKEVETKVNELLKEKA